jgi:uncharacterized glyoxalase superfamily protein PhnB
VFCVLRLGKMTLMLRDAEPDTAVDGGQSAAAVGITVRDPALTFAVYVPGTPADVRAVHARSVSLGAKSTLDPQQQPWGEYSAAIVDPFGYSWTFNQAQDGAAAQASAPASSAQ